MKVQLISLEKDYHLSIAYPVKADLAESWDLIASNAGFAKWFPQLRIEGDKLIFEMEDFREEMELLTYQEEQVIAYDWDGARVSFQFENRDQGSYIHFEEVIPKDFGNEFSNAAKDMTGWLVQNEFLSERLNGQDVPDRAVLRAKWSDFVEEHL
ncbi:ATPase [Streptococcus sp.]|uniref:ATPase n=1 Tax=Streptococcus sp. TaxID=1306 RepID=UPI0035A0DEDE